MLVLGKDRATSCLRRAEAQNGKPDRSVTCVVVVAERIFKGRRLRGTFSVFLHQ